MANVPGDSYYGIARPNWVTTPGVESLTSAMDFVTIYTGVDIRPASAVTVNNTATATASTTLALGSSTTAITVGMWLTGASVVGSPVVTSVVSGTSVIVSTPQTLSASAVSFTPGYNLDRLIEIISLRGQPVIMGGVSGSGPYSMIMATEHLGWSVMQNPVATTTAASASATATVSLASTAGISAGMQVYGPTGNSLLGASSTIPTVVSVPASGTVSLSGSITLSSGSSVTFVPNASAAGSRLIDRIVADGVNFGWQADSAANTLGVVFSSVLT